MEVHPIYVLKAGDELSPVFESPLSLFDPDQLGPMLEEKYGIPRRRLTGLMSPWCYKRLEAFGGDISQFRVAKIQPSRLRQIGIAKTEPGDENNQDISSLVGKVDIRKLETYAQNDPDAYSYSGGLNRANQGVLEFVEMFKAPIKMLHPLLTATQEGNYIGTENIGAIPFTGVILAHSNEAEWSSFKANKNNEAFIDRICVIKVPYCLRITEEQKIYEKLIQGSELAAAPCAPATLETLARFSVMSRLRKHENSTIYAKMRVYDGESLKETDPKARSVQEYRDAAGVDEGMDGVSTRFAFKILAATFNHDPQESRRRRGASDVRAGAIDQARATARGSREALPRIHQGRPCAALCRVHRQRDPEGLSRILLGLRPEPVRPLRRLRRCLDRGPGFQGRRHRPAAGS
ncbi:putative Ser/Thr protein kinase [Bradyrhizobium sp. GM6.1]